MRITCHVIAGADVDTTDEHGRTSLMNAVTSGHTLVAIQLLRARCDCNRLTRPSAVSALHFASHSGADARFIQILLASGADPTARDSSDHTPLSRAVHAACTAAVQAHTLGCVYEHADTLARTADCPQPLRLALDGAAFVTAASLVVAGYRGRTELREYFAERPHIDHSDLSAQERDGYRFMCTESFGVPPLQHLCRLTLRRQLSRSNAVETIRTTVIRLGLPTSLCDYICFHDIYRPLDLTTDQHMCTHFNDTRPVIHFWVLTTECISIIIIINLFLYMLSYVVPVKYYCTESNKSFFNQ